MRIRRTRVALAIVAIFTLLPLAAAPTLARGGARAEHDRIVARNSAVMYGPKFNSRTQATYHAALRATANVKVTGS